MKIEASNNDVWYKDQNGNWVKLPHGDSGKQLIWDADKVFRNKIILTTIIAAFFGILGGFGVGFVYGMAYEKSQYPREMEKAGITGYTVLDADHVIMSNGDTVRYNWNKPKMRK